MKRVGNLPDTRTIRTQICSNGGFRGTAFAALFALIFLCSAAGSRAFWAPGDSIGPLRQIVVIPFKSQDDDKDTVDLGEEIADSVTNRLNKLDEASVIDQEIVHKQMLSGKGLKTAEARDVAASLGADFAVTGTYKHEGSKLVLECSIVDVKGKVAKKLPVFEKEFPAGYATVVHELTDGVETSVRTAIGHSAPLATHPIEISQNIDANKLFATGLSETGTGTKDGLTLATTSLREAVAKDIDFAQAYAALADAESRLAQLKLAKHEDAKEDIDKAVADARTAVRINPYFGEAHWRLSRALIAAGDYENAEIAARVASVLSPANAGPHLERSRALAQGRVADNKELRTALKMTPSIVLVVPELPRVTINNTGRTTMLVKVQQEDGFDTSIEIPPGASSLVGLIAGKSKVTTVAAGQPKTQSLNLEPDRDYDFDDKELVAEAPAPPKPTKPAPTPTAPAKPTFLDVQGNVPGAKLTIDGADAGTASGKKQVDPHKNENNEHTVTISADGYVSQTMTVTAPSGKSTPVAFTLAPAAPVRPRGPAITVVSKPQLKTVTMLVPGGTFTMGDNSQDDNKPHQVTLPTYWIAKNPVTVKEFRAFTDAEDGYNRTLKPPYDWKKSAPPYGWKDDNQPMVNVTWEEAQAYCHWVGGELPTEAQWEYAARGPDGLAYPWGDKWDPARLQWSPGDPGSAGGPGIVGAHDAGQSPFGCLDMEGNVAQWCLDGYQSDITAISTDQPGQGQSGVVRGGSWSQNKADQFLAARRTSTDPETKMPINPLRRYPGVGFRVAMWDQARPAPAVPQPAPAQPVAAEIAARAATTTIIVDSNVPGARVSFDGVDVGPAPYEQVVDPDKAAFGLFTVVVTADGYRSVQLQIGPTLGHKTSFPFDLTRLDDTSAGAPATGAVRPNPKTKAPMVFIPEGHFSMGDASELENPPHQVSLSAYWIGKTPVTVRQFRAFTDDPEGYARFSRKPFDWVSRAPKGSGDNGDLPMENVTWAEAQAYCHWAGGELPTEAQWEHAARGDENTIYPWGNDFDPNKLAWSEGGYGATDHSAGVLDHANGQSGFGVLDMAGNVCQFCLDGYQSHLTGPVKDPVGAGDLCVVRGGSYLFNKPESFRATARMTRDPITRKLIDRSLPYKGIGFRLVRPTLDSK